MRTKNIDCFGSIYILTDSEIEKFESLSELFEEEEQYLLSLKNEYSLEVREDLLILFVQMYLLRFAIPYFQLTQNKFPNKDDTVILKKVLYSCLTGRSIDDLVDNDSKFFKPYESIFIFQKYYSKLSDLLIGNEKFNHYLFESSKYQSPILQTSIEFEDISIDIYERIKYFYHEAENYPKKNVLRLKTYMGILLGSLDVNDLIADGFMKNSSTAISNHAYQKFYNDEGKLLLDKNLFEFYNSMESIFQTEAKKLAGYCNTNKLLYTANILNSSVK